MGWNSDCNSYFYCLLFSGRIDYNFAERYMLQVTVRRDGSSHFGANNKWGVFPSFSLGWNVWNEPYLAKMKPEWFDVLKFRFSWGRMVMSLSVISVIVP